MSLLSLNVHSSTSKTCPVHASTGLSLAAAFHCDFSSCNSDLERRKICQNYRDRILSISQFADVIAAALQDAFPQSLRESSRGEDAKAWTAFASLAQRQKKSRNREAQLLQLQTSIVALWGKDVFTHYGWRELPLDSTKLLYSVAIKLPQWDSAVEAINGALIERHERRVVKHDNRAQRIGEHSRSSKIQHRHSPVEPRDLESILVLVQDERLQVSTQANDKKSTDTIDGSPIRQYGLKRDRYSMIVPDAALEAVRRSSTPSQPANKRRRVEAVDPEGSIASKEPRLAVPSHQPAMLSNCRSSSEMTELEEESLSISARNVASDPQRPVCRSESQSELNNVQSPTPSVRRIQDSNEPEAVFTISDSLSAHKAVALLGEKKDPPSTKISSGRKQGLRPASMSEGVTLSHEALSSSGRKGRSNPAITERSKKRYCTSADTDSDGKIIDRVTSRYTGRLRGILETAREHHDNQSIQEQNRIKVGWLEETQWADVHTASKDFGSICQLPLNADVWCMDWEDFQKRADSGKVFRKPIIIKQKFQDSGMHEPHSYMELLHERYPNGKLDMQNSETGECVSKSISDLFAKSAEHKEIDTEVSMASTNAINLRKIANADAPLLTRLKRFRLLETLIDRVSNLAPGKRTCREAYDVADCIGFDLLSSSGSFSRPHVDSLAGTWIRCLSGSKAWIFARGMSDEDWNDFAQHGGRWVPGGKGRMVILEKDDVLLMPPGVRTLHAVFTLETSLMEGGMLWDECNIPDLLDELFWVGKNQSCTNEATAYQLPSIIQCLEAWIKENGVRLSVVGDTADYIRTAEQGIKKLQSLGCKCSRRCDKNSGCCCVMENRRCTAWCSKHPALPGRGGQARRCMHEL
jgi:hypothetical protein